MAITKKEATIFLNNYENSLYGKVTIIKSKNINSELKAFKIECTEQMGGWIVIGRTINMDDEIILDMYEDIPCDDEELKEYMEEF